MSDKKKPKRGIPPETFRDVTDQNERTRTGSRGAFIITTGEETQAEIFKKLLIAFAKAGIAVKP